MGNAKIRPPGYPNPLTYQHQNWHVITSAISNYIHVDHIWWSHKTWRHMTSWHDVTKHHTSQDAMSCNVMLWRHVTSCHVMSCHDLSYHVKKPSNSDKNCWTSILNVVTSPLWRHRVTWRRRWRHHSTAHALFSIGFQQERICYLQQFSRYLAWNVMSSWLHHWHRDPWINYPCKQCRRTMH